MLIATRMFAFIWFLQLENVSYWIRVREYLIFPKPMHRKSTSPFLLLLPEKRSFAISQKHSIETLCARSFFCFLSFFSNFKLKYFRFDACIHASHMQVHAIAQKTVILSTSSADRESAARVIKKTLNSSASWAVQFPSREWNVRVLLKCSCKLQQWKKNS